MTNKFIAIGTVAAALLSVTGTAYAGKDLDAVKARGACLRRQHRPRRLLDARQPGQLDRPRRRRLPRRRRRASSATPRRCGSSPLTRAAALHRAAVGRDRHPVAQHHLDPRPATPRSASISPASTLRRPGLHGAKKLGVKSAKELERRHDLRAARHHDRAQPRRLFPRQQHDASSRSSSRRSRRSVAAFFAGRCDVYTTDASGLASTRAERAAPNPDDYVILPEMISKEPLGPAVRHGDDQFVRHRALVALRDARGRGVRHHLGERRRDAEERRTRRSSACSASRRRHGQGARRRREVGLQHRQAGRQLRRESSSATSARTARSSSSAA